LDRLLAELSAQGLLDGAGLEWVRAHQAAHGDSMDSALLTLDLVGEADLARALEVTTGLVAADPVDLARLDPELGRRLPQSFSRSFSMCPGWLAGADLVVWVESPLPE
jgi:hypothetical protein